MTLRSRVAKLEARTVGGQAAPRVYTVSLNEGDPEPVIPPGYEIVVVIAYVDPGQPQKGGTGQHSTAELESSPRALKKRDSTDG